MRTRSSLVIAILAVVWTSARLVAEAQPPTLPSLLGAAAAYVAQFEARAAAYVFEEHYVQTINRADSWGRRITRRELRSEVIVINAGETGWIGFRDVFEVDGKPVHDRQDRLQALFVKPSTTTLSEARAIADEGARFNLGTVQRNLNFPTMALMFLRQPHQPRSVFSRERSESVNGTPTWVVEFSETKRPSLIGSPSGDVITSGRFWIEPDSGRVRRSQVDVKEGLSDATITVAYGPWPGLDILMPVSMEERLSFRGVGAPVGGSQTSPPVAVVEILGGRARYSNPKRFTVEVETAVQVPR